MVRTGPFHGLNTGSIPVESTKKPNSKKVNALYSKYKKLRVQIPFWLKIKMIKLIYFKNLVLTKINNSCFYVLTHLKHLEENSYPTKKTKINIFAKKFFWNFLFNLIHFILLKIISYYFGSPTVGNICTTELLYFLYFFTKFYKEKIIWEHLFYSFLNYFLIIALIPVYVYILKYIF